VKFQVLQEDGRDVQLFAVPGDPRTGSYLAAPSSGAG
jgi:hypothetical protein